MKNIGMLILATLVIFIPLKANADPPSYFDLRNYGGKNYVTSVKDQQGGTCWTHGTMASIESNLLMTEAWINAGEGGEPSLAEYHLDWWNGFNDHNNDDIDPPSGSGLEVHYGGDYMVSTAYFSRGEGAVRDIDGQSFNTPPARFDTSYHYFYVRNVEWFVAETDLSNINTIKNKIMSDGVMATCLCSNSSFMTNYIHYQHPSSTLDPNHSVAIIGWDDNLETQAQFPGAWLCKNSWGSGWGYSGYFWISYYDKHCGQNWEMGTISFQDAEPMRYDQIYFHDYHGWRDTKTDCDEAFNAFMADDWQLLEAVSFFVAADDVNYTIKVYDRFEDGELLDELTTQSGTSEYRGFRTIDLTNPVNLVPDQNFYIYIQLSSGGQPYDCTSDVPVLLGASYRTIVESSSNPGESYYFDGLNWVDLRDFDTTANFCIKGLASQNPPLNIDFPYGQPMYLNPGESTAFTVEIKDGSETFVPGTGMFHFRRNGGGFSSTVLTPLGSDLFEAVIPVLACNANPEYYISADGDGGSTINSPSDAPTQLHIAYVGSVILILEDNFETDLGWTTDFDGAYDGFWDRGVPVNDPDWTGDPSADSDGSGQCYLTDNDYGNTDVDGGGVILISPIFDLSAGVGIITYDYYLYLSSDLNGVDMLLVEINNDGGVGDWTEVTRHDLNCGFVWHHGEFNERDINQVGVELTSTMMVRFTAIDAFPGSIVEAGIDAFSVSGLLCDFRLCGDIYEDGNINILDILYLIEYKYQEGPAPDPLDRADVNADTIIDVLDILYLIEYKYQNGPEPNCP